MIQSRSNPFSLKLNYKPSFPRGKWRFQHECMSFLLQLSVLDLQVTSHISYQSSQLQKGHRWRTMIASQQRGAQTIPGQAPIFDFLAPMRQHSHGLMKHCLRTGDHSMCPRIRRLQCVFRGHLSYNTHFCIESAKVRALLTRRDNQLCRHNLKSHRWPRYAPLVDKDVRRNLVPENTIDAHLEVCTDSPLSSKSSSSFSASCSA